MKSLFMLAFAGFCGAVSAVTVGEGWTIVYPTSGNNGVERAMRTVGGVMQSVFEEALGAKLPEVPDTKAPKGPGKRIFIGGVFAERAGLRIDDFKGLDYGIAEKGGDIYLYGRDRTGASPNSEYGCVIPSALAATRFMQKYMNVLFLMPGKVGREVPKLDRLVVPDGCRERGSTKSEYQSGRGYDLAYNLANNIYGRGAYHTYGGHTYPVACPRAKYFKEHPEYFGMNRKGERAWGGSDGCQAYCISNPEFRKLVYEEMLRRYDAGADVCQLGQNDGSAVCWCPECQKLYGDTGDDYGEKIWLYHKEIAERLLKDRPGKLVHIMCYGDTANPPETFKVFPENVLIEICRYGEEDMRKWDGYVVPHGFTYYIYNWSWYPLLGFTPKRSVAGLVDQVRRFHKYGMKGIYRCGFGEMFGMEGPAYWVYNHLVDDPDTDAAAALATYYRGAFGPAAAPMKRFYEDLEAPLAEVEKLNSTKASDLVEGTIRRTKRRDPILALATVYTPERVARMDAALKEAQRTEGLSDKQQRRLQLVRTEWNYVRNMGSIAWRYRQFAAHPTKAGCDGILELLDERNAMIERLFPDGKVRRIKGWPELSLFGNPPLAQFRENGRLGATIRVPLSWNVAEMRKYRIVPGELMTPEERRAEIEKAGLRPLTGFRPLDDKKQGSDFRPYPDGTGFTLVQGTNHHVRATLNVGAKQGLLPGRTYRISWLARWEHVNAVHPWHGFYFSANFDSWKNRTKDRKVSVEEPPLPYHYGTSDGWVRESAVMTVCDLPNFSSEFTFRYWGGSDGVAEVRDVTIEELKD